MALKVADHITSLDAEWFAIPQKINSLFSKPHCPTGTEQRDFQRTMSSHDTRCCHKAELIL